MNKNMPGQSAISSSSFFYSDFEGCVLGVVYISLKLVPFKGGLNNHLILIEGRFFKQLNSRIRNKKLVLVFLGMGLGSICISLPLGIEQRVNFSNSSILG
jgi:hypothetical protein